MKIRRFYPKQVLRRLRGRHIDTLSHAERHALAFFMGRSRLHKNYVSITNERIIQVLGGHGLVVLSGSIQKESVCLEPSVTATQLPPAGRLSSGQLALLMGMNGSAFKADHIAAADNAGHVVMTRVHELKHTILTGDGPIVI
jgi:hypothetical protein